MEDDLEERVDTDEPDLVLFEVDKRGNDTFVLVRIGAVEVVVLLHALRRFLGVGINEPVGLNIGSGRRLFLFCFCSAWSRSYAFARRMAMDSSICMEREMSSKRSSTIQFISKMFTSTW